MLLAGIIIFVCDILFFYELINYKKRNFKKTKYDIYIFLLALYILVMMVFFMLASNNFGINGETLFYTSSILFSVELIILLILLRYH